MKQILGFFTGFNLDAIFGWLIATLGLTACLISYIKPNFLGVIFSVIGLGFGLYLCHKAGPIHALFDTRLNSTASDTADES